MARFARAGREINEARDHDPVFCLDLVIGAKAVRSRSMADDPALGDKQVPPGVQPGGGVEQAAVFNMDAHYSGPGCAAPWAAAWARPSVMASTAMRTAMP